MQWYGSVPHALLMRWVARRNPIQNPYHLTSHNLYIFPSSFGWLFALIVFSITTGAINYQLNAAYLLVFILIALGLLSMWQSHQNLKGLSLQCLSIEDSEQGTPAKVSLVLQEKNIPSYNLKFYINNHLVNQLGALPIEGQKITLPLETPKRGVYQIPPIKLLSTFPFGIFNVWSYLRFDTNYFVYPAATNPGFWPKAQALDSQQDSTVEDIGDDELYELQPVENPWVQAGRVAWKISARGQGWFLKKMARSEKESWVFSLEDTKSEDIEKSLEYLSYWIQEAERNNQSYCLMIKNKNTGIGHGSTHMRRCLRLLAAYS